MSDEQRKQFDAICERLAEAKTPHPTDAWERLYEQQVAEAWKASQKEQQCQK